MEYNLKDKINITKSFIDELAEKSWQEIEHIQSQIANISDTVEGKKVEKLLNSLLTSYYVFIGGLENFESINNFQEPELEITGEPVIAQEVANEPVIQTDTTVNFDQEEFTTVLEPEQEFSEPFEYFVDFDDPIGEPITDKDLYNN